MGEIAGHIVNNMQSGKYCSSFSKENKMAVKKRTVPLPPKAGGPGKVASKTANTAASTRPTARTAPAAQKAPTKDFSVQPWNCEGEGKRILIYAESGMGKTTLASLAPGPAFIGIDDGGKLITDGAGKKLRHVPGIETFADVRAALQADIYADDETVVIDQATYLQEWAVEHVLANITNEKGAKMDNIVRYGYGKGYQHLYDTMKLILQDCDGLIRRGKNVIIIAQSAPHSVANAAGDDFLREGPRLYSGKNYNIEALYSEWSDHLFRIGYQFVAVNEKKATGTNTRAIFTDGEQYFRAKSRGDILGPEQAIVSFEDPTDDSIWQFLFGK